MNQPSGFVYVIATTGPRGPKTYVGWALNPDLRLKRHNAGKGAKSTRGRIWQLVYVERHPSRIQAMSREWHLKRDRQLRKQLAAGCISPPLSAGPVE